MTQTINRRNPMNNIFLILCIAICGIAITYAIIQQKKLNEIRKELLQKDLNEIGAIDDQLTQIRDEKQLTLDELKKSRERLDKLIEATEKQDTTVLSLEEALKIINGLK